jgi:hypothetical protein
MNKKSILIIISSLIFCKLASMDHGNIRKLNESRQEFCANWQELHRVLQKYSDEYVQIIDLQTINKKGKENSNGNDYLVYSNSTYKYYVEDFYKK